MQTKQYKLITTQLRDEKQLYTYSTPYLHLISHLSFPLHWLPFNINCFSGHFWCKQMLFRIDYKRSFSLKTTLFDGAHLYYCNWYLIPLALIVCYLYVTLFSLVRVSNSHEMRQKDTKKTTRIFNILIEVSVESYGWNIKFFWLQSLDRLGYGSYHCEFEAMPAHKIRILLSNDIMNKMKMWYINSAKMNKTLTISQTRANLIVWCVCVFFVNEP